MPRPSRTRTLAVWMNGELVGRWTTSNAAQEFSYADEWLTAPGARAISLSMPLGPEGMIHRGAVVENFFENLVQADGDNTNTHILKLPIGTGTQGLDLGLSVENEWLCAQILHAFGIASTHCWMDRFDDQTVLEGLATAARHLDL